MAVIGLIFARGGSKSIINKNLQYIRKNRLIDIAVLDLKNLGMCELICISSDSEAILNVANTFNIKKLKRPDYLATDNSPEIEAWKHSIECLELSTSDILLIAPTTSPFRSIKTLKNSILLLEKNPLLDGVSVITDTSMHPTFNMVRKLDNEIQLWDQKKERLINRQQGNDCYDVTTVCFCYRASAIKKMNNIFDGHIGFVEVSNIEALDIDTPLDLEFARYLANSGSDFISSLNKNYL